MRQRAEMYRDLSVLVEMQRAIKLLRLGLAEIQNISDSNDFYDPVFINLSGGIERLYKCMLCLNFKKEKKRFPNVNEIWKNSNGHDLVFLRKEVENICAPLSMPIAQKDYDIIISNSFVDNVCQMLSEYGRRARYFNLDAVLGIEREFDTKKHWESMETKIMKELYGEQGYIELVSNPGSLEMTYKSSNVVIVSRLEEFFRALSRQIVFGQITENGKNYWFELEPFIDIDDSQLGTIDYRKFGIEERIRINRMK